MDFFEKSAILKFRYTAFCKKGEIKSGRYENQRDNI